MPPDKPGPWDIRRDPRATREPAAWSSARSPARGSRRTYRPPAPRGPRRSARSRGGRACRPGRGRQAGARSGNHALHLPSPAGHIDHLRQRQMLGQAAQSIGDEHRDHVRVACRRSASRNKASPSPGAVGNHETIPPCPPRRPSLDSNVGQRIRQRWASLPTRDRSRPRQQCVLAPTLPNRQRLQQLASAIIASTAAQRHPTLAPADQQHESTAHTTILNHPPSSIFPPHSNPHSSPPSLITKQTHPILPSVLIPSPLLAEDNCYGL